MDCQFIPIYGKLVMSQTTSFPRTDINFVEEQDHVVIKINKIKDFDKHRYYYKKNTKLIR